MPRIPASAAGVPARLKVKLETGTHKHIYSLFSSTQRIRLSCAVLWAEAGVPWFNLDFSYSSFNFFTVLDSIIENQTWSPDIDVSFYWRTHILTSLQDLVRHIVEEGTLFSSTDSILAFGAFKIFLKNSGHFFTASHWRQFAAAPLVEVFERSKTLSLSETQLIEQGKKYAGYPKSIIRKTYAFKPKNSEEIATCFLQNLIFIISHTGC